MADKKQNLKKSILIQGSILAIAGLITKVIGFIYRIPMGNYLGEQGNGIYTVSYGIYNIALTLSSYSMPLAVSKLVAARLAKGEDKNAKRAFQDALLFAIIVGTIAMCALYFGADALEVLYKRQGLSKPLKILAPTTLVVALLGSFRGYFQGHSNMVPTALSQIVEQIVNAIVSVVAAYGFMKVYAESDLVYAYGAAGGTLGTLCGAFVALLYFVILYMLSRTKNEEMTQKEDLESHLIIYKSLLYTIIPVILSQTVYQIGYTLDDMIYGNLMALKGIDDVVASSMQGVFNTQYNQLINLPVAISTAMASSTIPSMVASKMMKRKEEVYGKITQVVKINMLIAFPSMVGMTILSTPIMKILFPRLVTYQALASNLLLLGSSAIVFYSLSTITTAILQGNDYMRIPLYHSGISLIIHLILVAGLLYFTDLNVYACVIGNITFPLIVAIQNCYTIRKKIGYHWNIKQLFLKPLFSSLVMGVVTYFVYIILFKLLGSYIISTIVSVIASVIVYFIVVLKSGCLTREELADIPGGKKLIDALKL